LRAANLYSPRHRYVRGRGAGGEGGGVDVALRDRTFGDSTRHNQARQGREMAGSVAIRRVRSPLPGNTWELWWASEYLDPPYRLARSSLGIRSRENGMSRATRFPAINEDSLSAQVRVLPSLCSGSSHAGLSDVYRGAAGARCPSHAGPSHTPAPATTGSATRRSQLLTPPEAACPNRPGPV
jgi:hypothetical protein